jgi:hypothetical protein
MNALKMQPGCLLAAAVVLLAETSQPVRAATAAISPSAAVLREGTTWVVNIHLSAPLNGPVTIPVRVAGGSARIHEDYELSYGRQWTSDDTVEVSFWAGSTHESFGVDLLDDGLPEGSETFVLEFGPLPQGVSPGANSRTTLTIENLSAFVSVGLVGPSLEFVECNCPAIIPIYRHGDTNVAFTLKYSTSTNHFWSTAVPGIDFLARSGSVAFAAGERSRTLEIDLLDDGVVEDPARKWFAVHLYDATGGVIFWGHDAGFVSVRDRESPVHDVSF